MAIDITFRLHIATRGLCIFFLWLLEGSGRPFQTCDPRQPLLLGNPKAVYLGVPSPFFSGILLSRKPPESQGKRIRFLERTMKRMVEENGLVVGRTLCFRIGLNFEALVNPKDPAALPGALHPVEPRPKLRLAFRRLRVLGRKLRDLRCGLRRGARAAGGLHQREGEAAKIGSHFLRT